jgi:hypothetical protein
MKAFGVVLGTAVVVGLLAPAAMAQELRLELARKRQEVVRPAPADPQATVREAEKAVREYEEQVRVERTLEAVWQHDRRRDLDSLITHQKQALAIQRALRELRP